MQRIEQCFETLDEAKERRERAPKRQKRSHTPSKISGNLQLLLADVPQWKKVNWTEEAKKYNICKEGASNPPANAGQLLKEYLHKNGVDTEALEQQKSELQ